MILQGLLIVGTLVLMAAAAIHAGRTLPAGGLPMGRRETPDTNRTVVLLQGPAIYVAVLAFETIIDLVRGHTLAEDGWSPLPVVSVLMLVCQQAQYWGVRRIMRKVQG
jgi:hypothetical protein